MTTQTAQTTYEVGSNGTIFSSVVQVFADDNGNMLAVSEPHRTPYEPITLDGNGNVVATTVTSLPADIQPLANVVWTGALVQNRIEAAKALLLTIQQAP